MTEVSRIARALKEITKCDKLNIAALGNIGYAFAEVNPVPEIDREKRTVAIKLQVVPGPRVTVRQIQFKGNTRTTSNASDSTPCPGMRWRKCTMRAAAQPPKPVATTNR